MNLSLANIFSSVFEIEYVGHLFLSDLCSRVLLSTSYHQDKISDMMGLQGNVERMKDK